MASTMTQMVNAVGFVLVMKIFNVSFGQSINVGQYINYYHNKTRCSDYQRIRFMKFDANSLRQLVFGLRLCGFCAQNIL